MAWVKVEKAAKGQKKPFKFQLTKDGQPVAVPAGSTATITYRVGGGPSEQLALTLVDAATGLFAVADADEDKPFDVAGKLEVDLEVTTPAGDILPADDLIHVEIRDRVPAPP